MRILITNDDGIDARGIYELAKELSKENEVVVVAPREQKSASSHSISIHTPIKVREEKLEGLDVLAYSVVGTPADCTQVGINLVGGQIDLVVSGINRGLNSGTDILYSGTVSAAVEGAIYGLPALAVSMEVDWSREDEDYSKAARYARQVIEISKDKFLRKNVVLNLNIPNREEKDIKGLKVCRIGNSTYTQQWILIEEGDDKVYEIKGTRNKVEEKDSDLYFIGEGYATLTPLHYDLTSFSLMEEVKGIFEK